MPNHNLKKKCPNCKRWRKWRVRPNHYFATGYEWSKQNDVWVCYWCTARMTPGGEEALRKKLKELREDRAKRKKQRETLAVPRDLQ